MKTQTDNDPRSTEELKAKMTCLFKSHLEFLVEDCGDKSITMTAATESIWGSSGRGASKAVRIIKTLGEYGLVTIVGNKKRRVQVSAKGHQLLN